MDWLDLQCQSIRLIILVVFVFIDAIDYVDCIIHINFIDPGILNCSEIQLKDNSNVPTNSGMAFWGEKGKFSRFLASNVICKYSTRSFREINRISLRLMTSNYPWGKSFTLRNHWGSNILHSKKGGYYINLPPSIFEVCAKETG